jgi:hypothetical protein
MTCQRNGSSMRRSKLAIGPVTAISGRRSFMCLPFDGNNQLVADVLVTAALVGALLGVVAAIIGL